MEPSKDCEGLDKRVQIRIPLLAVSNDLHSAQAKNLSAFIIGSDIADSFKALLTHISTL